MTASKQSQWERLIGYVVAYQAVWIIDIGLKTGALRRNQRCWRRDR